MLKHMLEQQRAILPFQSARSGWDVPAAFGTRYVIPLAATCARMSRVS